MKILVVGSASREHAMVRSLASSAPFRDSLDLAHPAGAQAVIQSGGSRRDKDIIASADELGMAMVFAGARHFSRQ